MAQSSTSLLGSSIFHLLDGGTKGELQRLHLMALASNTELRTPVRSATGRFVANAILRRLDPDDADRVIWSFVDVRCDEPAPELALWGTEIGLWDWDVVNDRLTWINDWCEHTQLTAFSGSGHEQLWSARIHPEDLPAYRETLTRHLEGHTPPYDVEYRLRNRDDAWIWIQERGRVIERDAAGRAWRMVGMCLDADERHNSANALKRSESRLAHAVWGTSVGLWDHDLGIDTVHWFNDWCDSVDLDPLRGAGTLAALGFERAPRGHRAVRRAVPEPHRESQRFLRIRISHPHAVRDMALDHEPRTCDGARPEGARHQRPWPRRGDRR